MLEEAGFETISTTEYDKPYLYPHDPYDPDNAMVSELSSQTGKIIGPAKMMQVTAGQRIDLSTKYWYTEEPGDPLTAMAEIIAGTLLNMSTASIGVMPSGPEQGMGLLNNVTGAQFNQFTTFMNQAFTGVDLTKPQAYIVYLLFNDQMILEGAQSGVIQVGQANQLGTLSRTGIIPNKDGFFYVYVTNRSEGRVHFDNLTISHWQPMVRVAYDYYPFGLTWHNPALPETPEGMHDHAYQDKEFQWNEFGSGAGLALYDFHARMYDPATATWSVPDPAAQFSNPYLAMANNPVSMIDPTGTMAWDDIAESEEKFWNTVGTENVMMEDMSEDGDPVKGSGFGKPKYGHLVIQKVDEQSGFSSRTISSFSELSYPSPTSTGNDTDPPGSNSINRPVSFGLNVGYQQKYSNATLGFTTRNTNIGVGSNVGTGLSSFDFALGAYSQFGYNHTTYTTTKGIEKNIYKPNGEIRSARAAGVARASNVVRGVAVVGSVLSTGYSTLKVYDQWDAGGIQNVNGWDATDAGVGMIGLGATGLAYFGMISNPVGWVIGAGVLIYSGSRLAYDLYNEP